MVASNAGDYGVYEICWETESGGNVRMVGDTVVLHKDDDPHSVAWADYYCCGPRT